MGQGASLFGKGRAHTHRSARKSAMRSSRLGREVKECNRDRAMHRSNPMTFSFDRRGTLQACRERQATLSPGIGRPRCASIINSKRRQLVADVSSSSLAGKVSARWTLTANWSNRDEPSTHAAKNWRVRRSMAFPQGLARCVDHVEIRFNPGRSRRAIPLPIFASLTMCLAARHFT